MEAVGIALGAAAVAAAAHKVAAVEQGESRFIAQAPEAVLDSVLFALETAVRRGIVRTLAVALGARKAIGVDAVQRAVFVVVDPVVAIFRVDGSGR